MKWLMPDVPRTLASSRRADIDYIIRDIVARDSILFPLPFSLAALSPLTQYAVVLWLRSRSSPMQTKPPRPSSSQLWRPHCGSTMFTRTSLLGSAATVSSLRRSSSRSTEEVFASLDVSCTAATSLPPSRRCRLNGALPDELLLVTGLASLLETNLRAEPCETLHATVASPIGAGGCFASITREDWLALYEKERGEHVRLDWSDEPPSMRDGRAAAAPGLQLNWATLFSYRFNAGKHINLLELGLISLRRITREGILAKRLLQLVDSRVVLRAVSKGPSSRKIKFLLRKLGFWCLAHDIALELVWVPTWANPADATSRNKPIESWYASLPMLPSTPNAVLASAPASRSWICSVSHCRLRSIRPENKCASLNPPVPSVFRK